MPQADYPSYRHALILQLFLKFLMSENLDLIFGIELKQSTKEVEESLLIKSHNCMFTNSKDSIDLHSLIIFKKKSFLFYLIYSLICIQIYFEL